MSDLYRKNIYTSFANKSNSLCLKWVILHGAEGYPNSIGRDLDCYAINVSTANKLCDVFVECATESKDTLLVVFPNPLWGKRVLAISKDYDVAELHILYKINSGPLECRVDFNKVQYFYCFPFEKESHEFKSIVMSLLGNNKKVIKRMEQNGVDKYRKCLQKAYLSLLHKGKISLFDRLCIYLSYISSPRQALRSLKYSKSIKRIRRRCSTVPTFYIPKECLLSFNKISNIFLAFINGDKLSQGEINYHTSRQEMVFITKERKDIDYICVEGSSEKETERFVLDCFANYNLGNRYLHFNGKGFYEQKD